MLGQYIFVSFLAAVHAWNYGSETRVTRSIPPISDTFAPYHVSLVRMNIWGIPFQMRRSFCSGSIVSESWILTSAYCIFEISNETKIGVVAGKTMMNVTKPYQQDRFVISRYIHSYYPGSDAQHDIALLKVDKPFIFTDHVKQVYLPSKSAEWSGAWISGWGSTLKDDILNNTPVELKYSLVRTIDYETCRKNLLEIGVQLGIFSSQVCSLRSESDGFSCIDDSGSPLVYNQTDGTYVQLAIASWSVYPCSIAVYTRLDSYIDWIEERIYN